MAHNKLVHCKAEAHTVAHNAHSNLDYRKEEARMVDSDKTGHRRRNNSDYNMAGHNRADQIESW